MPTATTAACEVRPPREVTMPSAAYMPATSSGDVSARTRIAAFPVLGQLDGAVGIEHGVPHGSARGGGKAAGEQAATGHGALPIGWIERGQEELAQFPRGHAQQ